MSSYPRRPTDEEKKDIAEAAFPGTPIASIDFTHVWMLADWVNDLEFNCFAWSILEITTISIPDKLDTLNYLAGRAKQLYGAPYDYVPTDVLGDSVIVAWGNNADDIMHASRYCTKVLLQEYAGDFNLKLNFSSSAASGFPSEMWSSKFGDRLGFITHPRNWLSCGVWGTEQGALKIKQ